MAGGYCAWVAIFSGDGRLSLWVCLEMEKRFLVELKSFVISDEGGREEERFPRLGFTEPPLFSLASVDNGGFIGFLWRVRIC